MKRGWITWDKSELPPSAFETRLATVRQRLVEKDLPALVVYTDVWRSNQGRYLANFMPYWNRALLVIPRDSAPVLLCGLSPRVYPWIRSVTILEDIRPNMNVSKMRAENGWDSIGVLDLPLLPYDLAIENATNVDWSDIHPEPDEPELAMYRRAAKMARGILEEELAGGEQDIVARLELKYRRAGAEDLVILLHNGLISVALEYRGHWAKIARALGRDGSEAAPRTDLLSGPYPWEPCLESALTPGAIFARNGETWRLGPNGPELL